MGRPRPERWAVELKRNLRSEVRPSTFDLRSYLGSPLPVLGVPAAGYRRIVRAFEAHHPSLGRDDLHRLARVLWNGRTFEERMLAILLMDRHARDLDATSWRILDGWIDDATGWGLCDGLASGPVSHLVIADRRRAALLLRWTRSRNPWRRRAALYALHRLVRSGDLRIPLRIIDRLREDREFWVQRAVGTWLRECWKRDPQRIRTYLERHAGRLPSVALTVATERETKAYRARLRARARQARNRPG
jgi:3-methyladenine DNA glycosylase AlkD